MSNYSKTYIEATFFFCYTDQTQHYTNLSSFKELSFMTWMIFEKFTG